MTRTQVQLDDDTYEALRARAFRERKSMSAVVREMLRGGLGLEKRKPVARKKLFSFIGKGDSGRSDISERHDDYLAEDFM